MNNVAQSVSEYSGLFVCNLSGDIIQKTRECDAFIDPVEFISDGEQINFFNKIHAWIAAHPYVTSLEIKISKFTDGRGFSLAARFREAGFTGELHASGDITQDLIFLMRRVGFTHFHLALKPGEQIDPLIFTPFASHYQAAQDGSRAVWQNK
jgi:hypothetical protein